MYVCAAAGAARACARVLRVCVRVRAACMLARACCVYACVLRAGQTFSLAKPLSWTYCCSKASDPVTGQLVNSGTYARVSFTPRASRILYTTVITRARTVIIRTLTTIIRTLTPIVRTFTPRASRILSCVVRLAAHSSPRKRCVKRRSASPAKGHGRRPEQPSRIIEQL